MYNSSVSSDHESLFRPDLNPEKSYIYHQIWDSDLNTLSSFPTTYLPTFKNLKMEET